MKTAVKLAAALLLAVAVLFSATACGNSGTPRQSETVAVAQTSAETADKKITLTVEVIDKEGKSTEFTIKTDKDNLGAALIDEGLVEGEVGEYGLYITTVNGIVADYKTDGAYWALSRNGEYLMTGADSTPIADGDHYEITYTVN